VVEDETTFKGTTKDFEWGTGRWFQTAAEYRAEFFDR